jgi:hypothetical protein
VRVVLGAGLVATGSNTGVGAPLSVRRLPLVMVVAPLTPDSDAMQLLATVSAVRISPPVSGCEAALFTFVAVDELLTEPEGPRVPDVFTVIWSDVKRVATSATANPVEAMAVCGLFEAFGASVTTGVGPTSG